MMRAPFINAPLRGRQNGKHTLLFKGAWLASHFASVWPSLVRKNMNEWHTSDVMVRKNAERATWRPKFHCLPVMKLTYVTGLF